MGRFIMTETAMQSNKPLISYLLASVLPLFLFTWFAEPFANQVDFWLAWLVAMTMVSLPVLFAEIGLAKRSQQSPLMAMPVLTRESDVGMAWRGYAWLAQLAVLSLSALVIASVRVPAQALFVAVGMALPEFVIGALLMAVVLIVSVIGARLTKPMLWLAWLALVAVIGLHLSDGFAFDGLYMTAFSLHEWARALALALLCFAVGGGVYWWEQSQTPSTQPKQSASRQALPILAIQMVSGLVGLMLVALKESAFSQLSSVLFATQQMTNAGGGWSFGLLLVAGLSLAIALMSLTISQTKERLGWVKGMLMLLPALLLVLLPMSVLWGLTVILNIVSVLILSIFAGWQMKISHLRKSLNFANEAVYNLWRVAIRIFVPLALLLAMVGWVQIWIS